MGNICQKKKYNRYGSIKNIAENNKLSNGSRFYIENNENWTKNREFHFYLD